MLLDSASFVWRTLPVFACLVDHTGREQLREIEFADREAFSQAS